MLGGIEIRYVSIILLFLSSSFAPAQPEQYKRIGLDQIVNIINGDLDAAISNMSDYLKKHPNDLESLYVLSVAYAQKGEPEHSLRFIRLALEQGLPVSRFLAGPRTLLQPVYETGEFQTLLTEHAQQLLHGPLLGQVTDQSASFWIRTRDEVPVQVLLNEQDSTGEEIHSSVSHTAADRDYTAVCDVSAQLKPNTTYTYKISVDNHTLDREWRFRTFPVRGSPAAFDIGFGGGAGYTPDHERMWNTLHNRNLSAFLFLGDNVYIDQPTLPDAQRYCYYRRQSRPEFQHFTASTPIFAVWDDHDFCVNDGWGGPEIDKPEWKIPVWNRFRENWNNPYYGGADEQPGCWFDLSIADVDIFMLDSRYYRENPGTTANPSMLGPVQLQWLREKLKNSKATFKVIASPVPFTFGVKPGSSDPWEGFPQEREEIFSFIEENRIEGVILISADRHRSDLWKIERDNGYDFYEFESSRLTNIHTHEVMEKSIFGYNEKCSFGVLAFDTTKPDPECTYKIVNIDGEEIYDFTIRKSQLSFTQ
ncbi:MAG: alkaline phosphatase D family protein [bacterium]|jgi:alkaline phosphatase D